ncbi:MAG: ABC transporter permease [Pseudomonadota bacterium]
MAEPRAMPNASLFALLLRAQLRFARATPLTSLSALLGLALGIASIVAVHQICEQIVRSLDAVVPVDLRAATHRATRAELRADDYFELRRQWRAGDLAGVRSLAPQLEGRRSYQGRSLAISGIDWLAMPPISGRADAQADDASQNNPAPNASATDAGPIFNGVYVFGLGEQAAGARLTIAGQRLTVLGTADPQGAARLIADIEVAQALLGPTPADRLSAVLLQVADPLEGVRRALNRFLPGFDAGLPLPAPPAIPGWQVQDLAVLLPEQRFGRSVLFNLGALGTLSILVAWFLMYQTALLWFRRQEPVFALLRQQGTPQPLLFASFSAALLLLSTLAAALGVVLGGLLARGLLRALGDLEPDIALPWPPALALKVIASAVLVPLLSVLLVARAVRPVTAQAERRAVRVRLLVAVALTLLALALALLPQGGLLGGFAAILTGCGVLVVLLTPVLQVLRARRWQGLDLHLRMGVRELLWHPRDLAAALAALALAVATSIGIATMVQSFRADFELMLDQRLADDLRVEGSVLDLQLFATAVERGAVPDAAGQRRYEQASVRVEGVPLTLTRSRLDARGASRFAVADALPTDAVLLSEAAGRRLGRGAGDTVEIGGARLQVAALYPGYGDLEGTGQIDTQAPELRDTLGQTLSFELVRLGVDAVGEPRDLADAISEDWPTLRVATRAMVRDRAVLIFDRTFAITRALTAVALLVAAVGLYSALVALGLSQSRAHRLLTFMGQQRAERLRFALGRALAVTCVTLLLAVPLGFFIAAVLCYVVNPRGFGWSVPLTWQPAAVLWPLLWAFLAAVLAGLLGDRNEAH